MVTKCLLKTFVLLAAAALLSACAIDTGIRNAPNAKSLAAEAGAPKLKLPLPGGGERWFYTTGPAGAVTWRIDVAESGAVIGRVQVLTDDVFQEIRAGQSTDEVMMRIGPGYRKVDFERSHTTAWDYFYRDNWGYDADFSITFNQAGVVVSKISIRRDPSDKDP